MQPSSRNLPEIQKARGKRRLLLSQPKCLLTIIYQLNQPNQLNQLSQLCQRRHLLQQEKRQQKQHQKANRCEKYMQRRHL